MAPDLSPFEMLHNWRKSVTRTRGVTGEIRREIYSISDLYEKKTQYSLELYKLNYINDEEFVFEAGEVRSNHSVRNAEIAKERCENEMKTKAMQDQIDKIVDNRLTFLTSEVNLLRRKLRNKSFFNSRKSSGTIKALDGEVYEIRNISKNYERLVRKRHELYKLQVVGGVKTFRRELEEADLKAELEKKR
ncbi:hypothetical protein ACROYT_G011958 [Oculina patagonica]